MEQGRIEECFLRLHQCIDDAVFSCQTSSTVPDTVRDGLNELQQELKKTRMTLAQAAKQDDVSRCLQHLETTGDRTLTACRESGTMDRQLQNYVQQAHDVISELKYGLLH